MLYACVPWPMGCKLVCWYFFNVSTSEMWRTVVLNRICSVLHSSHFLSLSLCVCLHAHVQVKRCWIFLWIGRQIDVTSYVVVRGRILLVGRCFAGEHRQLLAIVTGCILCLLLVLRLVAAALLFSVHLSQEQLLK